MPMPPEPTAPLVELTGVAKTFPSGTRAVDGVSFTLRPGEFVSLLGPSGCGKSTLLRMIAGLSAVTRGVIKRAWDDEQASGSRAQPIGCVFQEPRLLPWATVWDNVYLPLRLQGISRAEARNRVDAILALVGLADFARSRPRQLSGGMQMRTAGARALVTKPQLLLLDEPFAALDEITRSRINDDLRALWQQQGHAVLFITHSVFEAVYLSTRVLVMSPRPGRIVEEIAIALPAKRDTRLRTSPEYNALCRDASAALERAMGAGGSPSALAELGATP